MSAFSIGENIKRIQDTVAQACAGCGRNPADVQVMAVTKTVDAARVNEAVRAGIRLLGENRAQELLAKYDDYEKKDVQIHFIGHLQSNKVRQVIDKVTMIQSLGSISLAEEIQRQCEKREMTMDCLVEVNIGNEITKSGIDKEHIFPFLEEVSNYPRLHVRGLMSIPPICDSSSEAERNFASLFQLFVDIKEKKLDNIDMDYLSMGMSDDYPLAIKHGSNLVRIGSAMFGRRG